MSAKNPASRSSKAKGKRRNGAPNSHASKRLKPAPQPESELGSEGEWSGQESEVQEDESSVWERQHARSLDRRQQQMDSAALPTIHPLTGAKITKTKEKQKPSVQAENGGNQDGKLDSLEKSSLKSRLSQSRASIVSEIASLSCLALEDPDKNFASSFHHLFERVKTSEDLQIRTVSILSVCSVLVDLLPSYRIRVANFSEDSVSGGKQVSQLVKQQWKQEKSFLTAYEKFVKFLIAQTRMETSPIRVVSSRCISELVEKAYHFNLSNEIIECCVHLLNTKDEEIRSTCESSVKRMFHSDESMEATLHCVKCINTLVKNKGIRVEINVLRVLLALPLSKQVQDAPVANTRKKAKAKSRKPPPSSTQAGKANPFSGIVVDEKQLDRDLAESQATVSIQHKQSMQTKIITILFAIYFRYLKNTSNNRILPIVLKGLSKFSHLINVELVLDLLESLRECVATHDSLSLTSRLYAVETAFKVLLKHHHSIQIDLKLFYDFIYTAPNLILDHWKIDTGKNTQDIDADISVFYSCVRMMFIQFRSASSPISVHRYAAILNRCAQLMLHLPFPHHTILLELLVDQLLKACPSARQALLEEHASDSGNASAIRFDPWIDDIDLTGAPSQPQFAFNLIKHFYHPTLATLQSTLNKGHDLPLTLMKQQTQVDSLIEQYNVVLSGQFNPPAFPDSVLESIVHSGATRRNRTAALGSESDFLRACAQSRACHVSSLRARLDRLQSLLAHANASTRQ